MRVCADLPNYIGYTWSCKAEYNKNKPEGENCYVSGNYTAEALNEVVTKFVQEWILCPKCNNPELNMKVKAKKGGQGTIKFDCSACGYSGKQKPEIMTALPKMTAHIFANPPSGDTGTQKIEAKQDEEENAAKEAAAREKAAKKAAKKNETEEERAIRKAKEKAEKAEAKAAEKAAKEARKAEKAAKKEAASPRAEPEPEPDGDSRPMTPAAAGADDARQDRLAKLEESSAVDKVAAAIAAEASAEDLAAAFAAASNGLESSAAMSLLFTSMADAGWKPALKLLKTHKALVAKTVGDGAAQREVLDWLSTYGAKSIAADDSGKGTAGKAVAKFLHTLYELDVVEEEVILGWNEKDGCGDDSVKQAVKPIIDFLEEDSDDEEDSD